MNLGIITTAIILVAISASPIIYYVASHKKNNHQLINSLKNLASKHQHTIHEFDICAPLIIGIDNKSEIIYFLKQQENSTVNQLVSIKEVSAAILEMQYDKNTNLRVVETLGIRFLPKKGHVSDVYWEFYNSNDTFQLNGELQVARVWVDRINKLL